MHTTLKLVGFGCFSIFCFSALAALEPGVVAVVGAKTITLDDFNKKYAEVKKMAVNPPPKKVFLEDLVRYEVGLQEAEKKNIKGDPIVAERINQEIYKGLIEKELGGKIADIKVSDSEMKDYYKNSPEIQSRHILIQIKPGASIEERNTAKKRAEDIYAEVKKSKRPFEELVKLYTDDIISKKTGGDIGIQTRLTVAPNYYDAADKLKPGEISPIVETLYGYHIIQLIKKNSFADSNKRLIRSAVFENKRLALFNQYFDKIKPKYKTTLNLDALN